MQKFLNLVFLIAVSCTPVRLYPQSPEINDWENDIRNFEHLDSTETYAPDAVLFAGSSSIRLWSTLAEDMAPYPVIQRGYGGAKLSDLEEYTERIVYPHPCRAIVLFIANDISGSEDDKSPEEVKRLFRDVLRKIRIKFPETPVFWIAITPTGQRWDVWPAIKEANSRIQEVCRKEKNTYFIVTEPAFLNAEGKPEESLFQPDRLHLNEAGYAVWTGIIKQKLNEILGE